MLELEKGRRLILTDTPVKLAVEEEARARMEKKGKKPKQKRIEPDEDTSSDVESLAVPIVTDDSDCEPQSPEKELPDSTDITMENLPVNTFVLIKVCGKKTLAHFAGIVQELNIDEESLTVQFYKEGKHFMVSEGNDIATVDLQDVVIILPSPVASGGTSTMRNKLSFDIDLSGYL